MLETTSPSLILASSSTYRRELLQRLTQNFISDSPDIDESLRDGEAIADLTTRLAAAKAHALAGKYPAHLIIGSDQSAAIDGHQLTKPGNHERAFTQLTRLSGRTVTFYTAVAVLDSRTMTLQSAMDVTEVQFRPLTAADINRYLEAEKPFDCAGSFKVEGLGISLFTRVTSEDPTALVGLPLIQLCQLLRNTGMSLP
jgi:septum formation protein